MSVPYLGDFAEDETVYMPFNTFTSDDPQASATITNLVAADIKVHKDGSVTQIVTDGATVAIDFDTITGNHLITIDTSASADYAVGSDYHVRIEGTTVDAGTVNAWIGHFSIENRFNEVAVVTWNGVALGTTNPLPNAAAEAAGGLYTRGTGAGQINQANNGEIDADINRINGQLATTSTGNLLDVNVAEISDDSTAADNLEATYDGTGYSDDNAPSTQAQLSGVSNTGSATNKEFTGEVLTTPATTTSGSYVDTKALDGTYMYWTGVTGGFDAELTSNIGAGTPSGIKITGYLNGANDTVRVQMWDYQAGTPAWVTVGSWSGGGSTVNQVLPYDAFIGMVGIGANSGNIRVRLYNDNGTIDSALTNANIYIDQVFVESSPSAISTIDAVYFDSDESNTNTVPGVDGVPGNPVSTEAAVNTLLAATGLHKVVVAIDSTITFATSHTSEFWTGEHWVLALGGQDVSSSHFQGADVSGVGTGTTAIDFKECRIDTATLHQFHMINCGYDGTLTLGEAGSYVISGGHSAIAGSTTPIIDMGAALGNTNLALPDWHNGVEIRNFNATGADLFSISGVGQIIYAASCSGTVNQRGNWKVTNTGGVTITEDDNTSNISDILLDTAEIGVAGAGLTDLGGMSTAMLAEVNAQLLDVLNTDTFAELSGVPAATSTLVDKLNWLFMLARNKVTQTATTQLVRNDADSATVGTSTHSDDATTYTRGEFS